MQMDPHTFARPDEVVVRHLELDLTVDFEKKEIRGTADLHLENKAQAKKLYLDTNGLIIERITLDSQDGDATFELGEPVRYLGRSLAISIQPETRVVRVHYATSPDALALQWLDPAQTSDKKKPFLYTQSQAILARSWIPCQDTPSVRSTYNARVQVPADLMAVMSAENPTSRNASGVYRFRMQHPIPTYLFALAVGDIEFRATSDRTGVYAEPSLVEKAAWEFAETPEMMKTVEKLYGPYRWGRYDVLVLPSSFPWGGMENPRLTFATPTLLAGDRSLVATIAHELAHSWSGNLITNASWNDFWLNEGFTNYLTYRIMEEVYGEHYSRMLAVLSFQDLQREVREFGPKNPDTHLKYNLAGRDPEDGVTGIPYEKGEYFLRTIEATTGRDRWDAFLKEYFDRFAFQSLTTEQFLSYFNEKFIGTNQELGESLRIKDWVYGPGIPDNTARVESDAFVKVDAVTRSWVEGKPATELETKPWSTQEWIHFLRHLPVSLDHQKMRELDHAFHFEGRNAEIRNEWLVQVVAKKYEPGYPDIEKFLSSQGRRKYVRLIFTELVRTPEGRAMALRIYEKIRPFYHSVARDTAEKVLSSRS